MANHVEPMDIDSDFDNKENSLHHNNVLPFTEKGYDELDVSELNMKLRYSVTPASSPMSKSFTANCFDNRSLESGDDSLHISVSENLHLTRSLNSAMTKNDNVLKSLKALPLKTIHTEQFADSNRITSVLRPLESTVPLDNANITVTVSVPSDTDENLSLPSSSSSTLQTPEATTPTKEVSSKDGGSPILRGLKSVFSMFRSSQSPIPSAEHENIVTPQIHSPADGHESSKDQSEAVLASTPIATHRKNEMTATKMTSPHKDNSIVFNDDLEKELQWKDETTIIFSQERIPIHKLMFQQQYDSKNVKKEVTDTPVDYTTDLNSTNEYMDISNNSLRDTTITHIQGCSNVADSTVAVESDTEFVDCETTFTKNEDDNTEDADLTPLGDTSQDLNITQMIESNNESGSRLKQIILDTTQDILNATLSVKPEDLLPEVLDQTKDIISTLGNNRTTESNIIESSVLQFEKVVAAVTLTEEPTATKVLPELSVIQAGEQIFDVPNKKILDVNFDVTKTEQSTLDITLRGDKDAENCNTTIVNEPASLDKSGDVSASSVVDNHVDNLDIEVNETKHFRSADANVHPITTATPTSDQQGTDLLLSNEIEINILKEPSVTELPVNIPLPDEDDLDKDFVLSDDRSNPVIPEKLPLHPVDNIKLMCETTEPPNNLPIKIDKINLILTDTVSDLTTFITGDNSNTNSEPILLKLSKIAESHEIIKENNGNICVSELSKEAENVEIPEDSFLSSKHANEHQNNTDTNLDYAVSTTDNGKNIINSVVANVVLQTILSTDDNENSYKSTTLPDIVNQTITISDTTNIETPVVIPELLKLEEIRDNIDIISNKTINPEVEPLVINETEEQISIKKHSQLTDETNENNKILPKPNNNTTTAAYLTSDMDVTCAINNNIRITESGNNPIELEEINVVDEHSQTSIGEITSAIQVHKVKDEVAESTQAVEEEVVLSGNNSPFTLVVAKESDCKGDTELEINEDAFATKTKLVLTPPNSPPIRSKGYNFNFDDLDFDPFATKTDIRMSPSLYSPKNPSEVKVQAKSDEKPIPKNDYRRQTQSDRKRPTTAKTDLNSTYHSSLSINTDNTVDICSDKLDLNPAGDIQINPTDTIGLNPNNVKIDEILVTNILSKTKEKLENESDIVIKPDLKSSEMGQNMSTECSIESNVIDLKATSSSEHSTYCTASDSSIHSRNVFNIPEIDDINFNPFVTKSKMCQSPPPSLNVDTMCSFTLQSENKGFSSEDKIENEIMEKDASSDLSSTTVSSKGTDERNITTREIHTEDEDTVEGPFLEDDVLSPEDKMTDFDDDNIDMMQFNELPTQSNEDNLDNGEMFIDAEAFEFLLNKNKTNTVLDSGKESLFLKFDPLFAKRMSAVTSDGVVASLSKLQNRQSTPTKVDQSSPKKDVPGAGPSFMLNETHDLEITNPEDSTDDINITISKPMMVVPPAVNPVTPRNKSVTPNRSNRRSITFTSPAMAVIDRLLSLSSNTSALYDTTVTQVSREQNEADIALSQLRELLAEKEINVYNLRSESNQLRDRLNTLESHVRSLETESQDRLKKINELNETLAEKTKINRSMAAVVEEYERTIASLISETAQDKKRHAEERIKLINERDEQTAHLASMEVSFSDLHSKYEKSKQIILNCKANEETYKKSIKEFEENFAKMQNNYELLKQHATSKLNQANQEMEKINRAHEAEVLKLNAMIKRKELHITSLEESLIQKTKANEELTAICDELINKVG